MKLEFLGGAGTVTGSKTLVESGGSRILVDCGLFQGLKTLRLRNRAAFPVPPASIDAVILTHAHIDHSGCLPLVTREGFRGSVSCTHATGALSTILLRDSARLQEEEAEYANRRGFSKHHPALPLYRQADADRAIAHFQIRPFHEEFQVAGTLRCRLTRAGHILGAASAYVTDGQASVLFSGDLGRPGDPVHLPPDPPPAADLVVIESTYGDREHVETDLMGQLEAVVHRTIARGGTVVVPSFAVGRAQILLFCLARLKKQRRIPAEIPVYLNSPMSVDATGIFCEHPRDHRLSSRDCAEMCEVAQYVNSAEESKRLNRDPSPKIIVSASGMATGGRVIHHLKAFGPEPKNTILLSGFQAAGTRGRTLLSGVRELKIHGALVPIRAEVAVIDGLSAHADQSELLDWLAMLPRPPREVLVNHGEPTAADRFAARIRDRFGWPARAVADGETVLLT